MAADIAPIAFEVFGRPIPKGSVTAFVAKGKDGGKARAIVAQGGSSARRASLGEWAGFVRAAAVAAIPPGADLGAAYFIETPLHLEIEFRLKRPKSHYRSGKNADKLRDDAPEFPNTTPDVDKLARSTLDAMTGVIFDDDKRIARLDATKVYAYHEGAAIRVSVMRRRELAAVVPFRVQTATPAPITAYPGASTPASAIAGLAGTPAGAELDKLDAAIKKSQARDRVRKAIAGTKAGAELHAYGKHADRETFDETLRTEIAAAALDPEDDFG